MNLSLTTDYLSDTGSPEDALRCIAETGFTHIHWCHHWNTDFLYSPDEIHQITRWLKDFHLSLLDLHGSAGREKCWYSLREYERLAGVELVRNRIHMTAQLGGVSVVMHVPQLPESATSSPQCDQVRRSIDELASTVRHCGVRLAFENMPHDDFRFLRQLLSEYAPDIAGICYDSGHGNIGICQGLDHLDSLKDRLIAVHIHDNEGQHDRHWLPFTGTVDFPRLSRILSQSSYTGYVSMESNTHNLPDPSKSTFLPNAHQAGTRLSQMIATQSHP